MKNTNNKNAKVNKRPQHLPRKSDPKVAAMLAEFSPNRSEQPVMYKLYNPTDQLIMVMTESGMLNLTVDERDTALMTEAQVSVAETNGLKIESI